MLSLLSILSYLSFVLLWMPSDMSAVAASAFIAAVGVVWILWKKPWRQLPSCTWAVHIPAAVLLVSMALNFYDQWAYSTKLHALASNLNLPPVLLVLAATLGLSVVAYPFLLWCFGSLRRVLKSDTLSFSGSLSLCLLVAMLTIVVAQVMLGLSWFSMGFGKFFFGCLIVLIPILALCCITGRFLLSGILGSLPFMILSTANVYVYSFRSRLLSPADFYALGTALNVSHQYRFFPIPGGILIAWALWIGTILLLLWLTSKKAHAPSGKQRRIMALGILVSAAAVFSCTAAIQTSSFYKGGAIQHGYILDFASHVKDLFIPTPKGYDPEDIRALAQQYPQPADPQPDAPDRPHIIVIMNEAFSDFNALGDLSTNTEVLPFVSSLKENCIYGYALSSVYGGNTANSEYEFLTGNSMAWLSPNAVPYQQYLTEPTFSMVTHLKENYGYHCVALHPAHPSNWNRSAVYTHFGFDEVLFEEAFPQEDYIRGLISDQEFMGMIIDRYEARGDDPLFLFGITLQNHGGYTLNGEDFQNTVSLEGYRWEYPAVETYLSLVHESDKAIAYLISYFEEAEEDVVVVFFGDHQPNLDSGFYTELYATAPGKVGTLPGEYIVPFFVWTNYAMESQFVECTSLNHLSTFAYQAAGIPLPAYNQFLSEMAVHIPAIHPQGFYSAREEAFLPFEKASEEAQVWLRTYEQLQYNSLFDKEHRDPVFFPVLPRE